MSEPPNIYTVDDGVLVMTCIDSFLLIAMFFGGVSILIFSVVDALPKSGFLLGVFFVSFSLARIFAHRRRMHL